MLYNLEHPDIQDALKDIKCLLRDHRSFIDKIELFGSTLTIPVADAKDIDFFVGYRNTSFKQIREKLLNHRILRNVVIESLDASYSNCPKWDKTTPLTLHIILFRDGESNFSEKLTRTRRSAIDVTSLVLNDNIDKNLNS